jgi:predicted nucleic acid-binding protein
VTVPRFIETNILLRQIARDETLQAKLTDQLFQQLANGEFEGLLSMTVFFETAFVLEKTYGLSRANVAAAILETSRAEGIRMLDGEVDILPRTLDYYLTYSQLSFADCYHAALALEHCNGEIYTFDKDFRRVPGIARLEPGA